MNSPSAHQSLLPRDAFEQALREAAEARYHDKHAFHALLLNGRLTKGQVQAWALNRYCFQAAMPRKDAILVSRSLSRDFRREWTLRILDHDGFGPDIGGIERWLRLTDGLGLDRNDVVSMHAALPKTHAIIESYLELVRTHPMPAAVATTLTELFSQQLHRARLTVLSTAYDFIDPTSLTYFQRRLTYAPRDASFALDYVLSEANTRTLQAACIEAIRFKCEVLWQLLDALFEAYVEGPIPHGAFVPDDKS